MNLIGVAERLQILAVAILITDVKRQSVELGNVAIDTRVDVIGVGDDGGVVEIVIHDTRSIGKRDVVE